MANERRLIDANDFMAKLEERHENIMQDPEVSKRMKWCEAVHYGATTAIIEKMPTIEATPINNNPCGFCGKFNFGDAKAEVYCHGANIVIASALTRFQVEEQFNFCPVCGRFVKKGR